MPAATRQAPIASVEEIVEEARNGRMVILVDDEDRENEGDLILPAQLCTPEAITFMAVHGRGLICLTLTESRVSELGLSPMVTNNGTRHGTAFTTSIEARHGINSGISAADRARTISVAIDKANGREAIVTPGHMFPLIARDGGVLVRAGHTEAAVDIARLAGLNPSGVICEVLNDDGTMARLDDLIAYGKRHGIKIGTIRDLIAYRRRHDNLVERLNETEFASKWGGRWNAITFRNNISKMEITALVKGKLQSSKPMMVRMHHLSPLADLFGRDCSETGSIERAMSAIEGHGSGVLVLLNDGRTAPNGRSPEDGTLRDYGIGAQILADLGVHDFIVLTNSRREPVGLEAYGLKIVETRAF